MSSGLITGLEITSPFMPTGGMRTDRSEIKSRFAESSSLTGLGAPEPKSALVGTLRPRAIACRVAVRTVRPCSALATVCTDSPAASARPSWLRPAARRNFLMRSCTSSSAMRTPPAPTVRRVNTVRAGRKALAVVKRFAPVMPARLTSYPASAVARQLPLPLGPCRRVVAYPALAPRRRGYGARLPVRLVDGAVGHAPHPSPPRCRPTGFGYQPHPGDGVSRIPPGDAAHSGERAPDTPPGLASALAGLRWRRRAV